MYIYTIYVNTIMYLVTFRNAMRIFLRKKRQKSIKQSTTTLPILLVLLNRLLFGGVGEKKR